MPGMWARNKETGEQVRLLSGGGPTGPTGPTGPVSTVPGPTGPTGGGMSQAQGDARYLMSGFRNVVRNGDMQIAQRGDGPFTASFAYNIDGWLTQLVTGGTMTISRVAQAAGSGPGVFYRVVFSGQAGASDGIILRQRIEGVETLAGSVVTLSFDAVAASGTPKIGIETERQFGTGGSASDYTAYGAITISTTKARYSLTFTMPSVSGKTIGAGNYVYLNLWYSGGSTFAARSSNIGNQNNTISVTDIQLEAGSVATPFERLPIQQQLAWCQRYFWRVGQTPSVPYTGSWFRIANGVFRATNTLDCVFPFPVPMRAVPTLSTTAASTLGVWNGSASSTCTAVTIGDCMSNVTANIFATAGNTYTNATPGVFLVYSTGTGYLDFSAEL